MEEQEKSPRQLVATGGAVGLTAYAYPWDVARLGAANVVSDLVGRGFDAIDLSTSYHPVDALSPRVGEARLFVSPRGAVYFPARLERYGRIQPYVWPDREVCAAWPDVVNHAREAGLGVNAWSVVLYQPWLVDAYPDCARVLPSGDSMGSGVCPASPDVQEYVAALCGDIEDQFGVGVIRLEGVAMPEFDYGWLRPQILFEISGIARQLLGLCFCSSCRSRAASAGLDVERLRSVVTGALAGALATPNTTEPVAERFSYLVADDELREFALQHERAGVELARSARSGLSTPRTAISVNAPRSTAPLFEPDRDRVLEELLGEVDGVNVKPQLYPDHVKKVQHAEARAGRKLRYTALLVGPVDMRLLDPADRGPDLAGDQCADEIRAALEVPVSEVSVYCYGLLHDRDIQRVVTTLAALDGRRG